MWWLLNWARREWWYGRGRRSGSSAPSADWRSSSGWKCGAWRRWTNRPRPCWATCSAGGPRADNGGRETDMATERPSLVRAWCYLVWLSLRRQARARQMVLIALGLLAFAAAFVAIATRLRFWDQHTWSRRLVQGGERLSYARLA